MPAVPFPATPAVGYLHPPGAPIWRHEGLDVYSRLSTAAAALPPSPPIDAIRTLIASTAAAYHNNPQTRPLNSGVTVTSSATLPGAYVRPFPMSAAGNPFSVEGGEAISSGGAYKIVAANTTGATREGLSWRVGCMVDGDAITFQVLGATDSYRFLVDGRYVSRTPEAAVAGSWTYYTLTFPARFTGKVQIEGQGSALFHSMHAKEDGSCLPLPAGLRIIFVGDSNFASTGQTIIGDGFVRVMSDRLGVADGWMSGVAGTGFVATDSGASNKYATRRADWTTKSPNILVLSGSANDISAGATAAQIKAAAALELTQARAALPGVPIFLAGIAGSREYFNSLGILSTFTDAETALSQAVIEQIDPLTVFVPLLNVPGQTAITGTGANGNALHFQPDGHLSPSGHQFMGAYVASRIVSAAASMLNVKVPAFAPRANG